MTTISRYVLVDSDDITRDYEFERYDDALAEANRLLAVGEPVAIIEYEYEYTDSSLVWTPDGGSEWPPTDHLSDTPA